LFNTDPGVYEPGDPYKASFTEYPDQDDFLSQLRASQQNVDLTFPVQKEFVGGMETVNEDPGWEEEDAAVNGIEADCGEPPSDQVQESIL
jgi:hypothetical protein